MKIEPSEFEDILSAAEQNPGISKMIAGILAWTAKRAKKNTSKLILAGLYGSISLFGVGWVARQAAGAVLEQLKSTQEKKP